ncbi:MAG: T9SS type A sorting domain-containing protein [Bacteroidota bacterium]
MKKFTLIVLVFVSSYSVFGQTVPNGGFENWSSSDPDNWKSSNFMIPSSVTKSTSANSGSNAAKLETKTYTFTAAPGSLTLGKITQNGFSANVTGGVPFTARPDSLVGYYKNSLQSGDASYFGVGLFKRTNGVLDTIALGKMTKNSTVANFTRFSLPLTYRSSETPDTMNILLMSSANILSALVGTVLYIDDLSFIYNPAGISFQIPVNTGSLKYYPNPAGSYLIVETEKSNAIQILNALGQVIKNFDTDDLKVNINVEDLPTGTYFVRAINKKESITKKLVISR